MITAKDARIASIKSNKHWSIINKYGYVPYEIDKAIESATNKGHFDIRYKLNNEIMINDIIDYFLDDGYQVKIEKDNSETFLIVSW